MSKKLLTLLIISSLLANRTANALEVKSEQFSESQELIGGVNT